MTRPLQHPLNGVSLAWRERPFSGACHHQVIEPGKTIAEIVALVPPYRLQSDFKTRGIVCINGEVVPREMWRFVRPRAGTAARPIAVTLHYPLASSGRSGGSRKNPLSTILSIGLLVGTFWVAGGGLGFISSEFLGAGTLGARIAAAGLAIAGSLAVNALSPPPSQPGANSGADDNTKEGASLDDNIIAPGGSIPRVLGTHRVYPPFACESLIEIIDDDEQIEAVMVLAGKHQLEDIRLGTVPVENLPDIGTEIRQGFQTDLPLTLVTRQGRTDAPQLTLSQHVLDADDAGKLDDQANPANSLPQFHTLVSRNSPDEIWLHVLFPEGLFNGDSVSDVITTPFRLRIRKKGDTGWINLPEVHFAGRKAAPFQKAIKILWAPAPPRPQPALHDGAVVAFTTTKENLALTPPQQSYTAHPYFIGASGQDFYDANTYTTAKLQNVALFYDRAEFYLDAAVFPKGIYEVEIERGYSYRESNFNRLAYTLGGTILDLFSYRMSGGVAVPPSNLSNIHNKAVITRFSSVWNENPVPGRGFTQIALKAKNRRIEQLSALASGLVYDWNPVTQAWDQLKVSSNPATVFRDVLTGTENADQIPADLIEDLTGWRQRCIDKNYTVNAVCEGMNVADVLLLVAAAGYARPRFSEKWGVVEDRDRSAESPVQIFTPVNLGSFKWTKAFPKRPHGIRAKFRNKDLDYQDDEIIVPTSGFDAEAASRLEEINYPGFVDVADVAARASFDYRQSIKRGTFYLGEADAEAIVCTRGDLVGLQHDTLHHQAGFARIKQVLRDNIDPTQVTGLVLDAKVPAGASDFFADPDFFAGPDFFADVPAGAVVRLDDGSNVTKQISAAGAESETIEFDDPITDDPDAPLVVPGQIVATGPVESEIKRALVLDMTPREGQIFQLTFVDEAPELFAA